jgi:holo-[acyl-carrier protein] synthase
MIFGIGNDIIEIYRIKKAMENEKFKEKVFTKNEINQLELKHNKYESYAGRFAAKEAISKSLNTGVKGFNLKDIEILNDSLGKPDVIFLGVLSEKYKNLEIKLTISHSKEYAVATAIAIEKNKVNKN